MGLSDHDLTQDGLAPQGAGRILVLACGALAREIIALTQGWDHIDLQCLPAILHNSPEKIPHAVKEAALARQAHYDQIFVAYADCGTGGLLAKVCEDLGVEMIEGPHCYSFFDGNAAFAEKGEVTSFYLTDFLARQFDAFVTKPLGLDRHPELRDMYFGNYTTLVYLAQTEDAALTEKAKGHAATLGLSFERRFTGYGDLEAALAPLGGGAKMSG